MYLGNLEKYLFLPWTDFGKEILAEFFHIREKGADLVRLIPIVMLFKNVISHLDEKF